MLKTVLISLQIVEKHTDNTHNFLLVEVIKDLSDSPNDSNLIIRKLSKREIMVGENPESSDDIVSNLSRVRSNLSGLSTLSVSSTVVLEQVS